MQLGGEPRSEALAYLSATDGVSVAQNRRLSSSSQLG